MTIIVGRMFDACQPQGVALGWLGMPHLGRKMDYPRLGGRWITPFGRKMDCPFVAEELITAILHTQKHFINSNAQTLEGQRLDA